MKNQYTRIEQLLHHVALNLPAITDASFRLEKSLSSPGTQFNDEQHVFVTSLARAGTTVLMRQLHSTGDFAALTYRHMPFVLMPGTWQRLTRSHARTSALQERAHGDGLLVNQDSPESFEEVFWKLFCRDDYIAADHLKPHTPGTDILQEYRSFVGSVLLTDGKGRRRYLSKNNNLILRLPAIKRAFKASCIVVPFRDPLDHAGSLLRQHRQFTEAQRTDPFVARYMVWLGHYEFGLMHPPFLFNGQAPMGDPNNIAYWLERWIDYFSYLLRNIEYVDVLVDHDELSRNSVPYLRALATRLNLACDAMTANIELKQVPVGDRTHLAGQLHDQAYQLHAELVREAVQFQ